MIPDSLYGDLIAMAEDPEQADFRRDILTTALIDYALKCYEIKPRRDLYDLLYPGTRNLINEKVK